MYQKTFGLASLVNLEEWQKIQDSLSESFGLTIRTVDLDGILSIKISGTAHALCDLLKGSPEIKNPCLGCISKIGYSQKIDVSKRNGFNCPFGLDMFVLPIESFGKKITAYIVLGPLILNKRKERAEYAKCAEEYGIDPEKLMDALIEINVFSYNKIRSIIKLITNVFSYMVQTAYHKKRLGEIAPQVAEIDPQFSRYYEDKVLDALLKTCAMALNADSGSVMTFNKNTNKLHIKVARKLNKDIADNAEIDVKDSIAGLAAINAMPILLPKDKNKNGLSEKMKRDYIKSSMVVPFSKANQHDVYGVINLNIIRRRKDFSDRDIGFVKELINLASIALLPVK